MSEIEQAVEYFEGLIARLGNGEDDNRICVTALDALREKAEREKGCDWCQQKHNRYLFTQIAALNAETPIACPWCGKRLEATHA